jgi:hypothetical protein
MNKRKIQLLLRALPNNKILIKDHERIILSKTTMIHESPKNTKKKTPPIKLKNQEVN